MNSLIGFLQTQRVRRLFQWKYSNWLLGLFWALGLGALLALPTLESEHITLWPAVALAYALFVAALIWSLGAWLTSKKLATLNPALWNRANKRRATGNERLKHRLIKYSVALAISALVAPFFYATYRINYRLELTRTVGVLLPGSDATLSNVCGPIPAGGSVLIYGNNAAVVERFPHTVLLSRSFGQVIGLDRRSDGAVVVLLDMKDPEGKTIVHSGLDGFTVNPHTVIYMERPDRSTLKVIDEYQAELTIRYLNPQALQIAGSFHYPGRKESVPFLPPTISHVCTTNFGEPDVTIQ
jgi:hypothetical protein